MVSIAMFVDSVSAMEPHLVIFVSAMKQTIHVQLEGTQYVALKRAQELVSLRYYYI